jgi:tRNA1Val (adenine37-N6)-methyltransferase
MFKFKQFSVDQSGCAMKINTDGVLLGALATADNHATILDVGTGTGVIALMLAQRFNTAQIDAVEIDETAAQTAGNNFKNSPFADRLAIHPLGFEDFTRKHPEKKYDMVVSNPPFYIRSLESPEAKRNLARHAAIDFFEALIKVVSNQLTHNGVCWLILPLQTADLVKELVLKHELYLHKIISLYSFKDDSPHREIMVFGFEHKKLAEEKLVIYDEPKLYSKEYREILKDFLIIF